MKSQDLMIGDWFQNPLGYPYRVKAIKCYYDDDAKEEYYVVKGVNGESDASFDIINAEPIPLTQEILEKNGFENSNIILGTIKMRWISEDTRTEITIWLDDTVPIEIRKNVYYEDEESYSLPFPGTVSQLQHALRLCGIKKEIVV